MKHSKVQLLAILLSTTMTTTLLGGGLSPDKLRDLVIYEVFVRQFSEEGTIDKVTERLSELKSLGIDVVWLMPIYPIGQEERKGTHGSPYAIKDYRAVNPELGTKEQLEELVDRAHAMDMKVILDFVPNHTAWDHPYVEAHKDWYHLDDNGNPKPPIDDWADVLHLNYDNPGVRAEIIDVMKYWLTECGIDGYRVDVAGMVPRHFWEECIPELQKVDPDIIMLAEADGAVYHEQGFGLSYNGDLRTLLWEVCAGKQPVKRLGEYIEEVDRTYPEGAVLLRFTENHDIERTTSAFPDPVDEVAAAFVFTLEAAPLIYAGQEYGISDYPDLFIEDKVPWEKGDPETRDFYKKLCRLRHEHEALTDGVFKTISNSHEKQLLTYLRQYNEHSLLVALNFSGEDIENATLSGVPVGREGSLRDLWDERDLRPAHAADATLTIDLPAHGIRIIDLNAEQDTH